MRGHARIEDFLALAAEQFPGHHFERTSAADGHHELVRFGWALNAPDGTIVVEGVEVGGVAPDGRLTRTVGFFGPLPTPAAALDTDVDVQTPG